AQATVSRPGFAAATAAAVLGTPSTAIVLLGSQRAIAVRDTSDATARTAHDLEILLGEGPVHALTGNGTPIRAAGPGWAGGGGGRAALRAGGNRADSGPRRRVVAGGAGAGAGGLHRGIRADGAAGVPDRDPGDRGRRAQRGRTPAGRRRVRRLGAAAGGRAGADAPARGTARGRPARHAGHRAASPDAGRDGAQPHP